MTLTFGVHFQKPPFIEGIRNPLADNNQWNMKRVNMKYLFTTYQYTTQFHISVLQRASETTRGRLVGIVVHELNDGPKKGEWFPPVRIYTGAVKGTCQYPDFKKAASSSTYTVPSDFISYFLSTY
jgi:hypothetical protein